MSYADRDRTGENTVGMIVSGLIIAVVSYGLYLGMSVEGIRQAFKKLTTVEIKKDEPKKTPPPPPKPMKAPPPIVAPPPKINVSTAPPPVQTVVTPPPLPPPPVIVPPPPAAPPPPKFTPKAAQPKGRPGDWASSADYPSGALRREEHGTTRFRVTVGPDGRVTSCEVTGSSGSSELDSTTCTLITRRGRFSPATDGDGNPTSSSWSSAVRWEIPKDE